MSFRSPNCKPKLKIDELDQILESCFTYVHEHCAGLGEGSPGNAENTEMDNNAERMEQNNNDTG